MKLSFYFILFFLLLQITAWPGSAATSSFADKKSELPDVSLSQAEKFMIVTANPIATQAGYDVLKSGGTAADAAYAAQLVLGLVEPQSSGLGGGAFALYWDASSRKLTAFDARETAPAKVTEDLFMKENGQPMTFKEASIGGRAVGVPGLPALLDVLQVEFGRSDREQLFQPALELSKYGFITSPRLVEKVKAYKDHLRYFQSAKSYFLPDDQPFKQNQNIINSAYYETLIKFKERGAAEFYKGGIAQDIVKTVQDAWHNPGKLSMEDLGNYEVKKRAPVCRRYRIYKICSIGEPSSGGLTLIQALGLLERFDLKDIGPEDPLAWHLIAQASHLAFTDRNLFMADPDYVQTPGASLIDPIYLAVRSSLIEKNQALEDITAGIPPGWATIVQAPDLSEKESGTTHIVARDRYGNAISLTSSVESTFGAKIMSNGFVLNNQLTDFSFTPTKEGRKVANRVEPGKRPRSSMAPVIVFDPAGNPVMLLGSAGGSRIIGYVLQRIIAVLDWQMDPAEALRMPNMVARSEGHLELEANRLIRFDPEVLQQMGYQPEFNTLESGLTLMVYEQGQWLGAADPRREGVAMGE